LIRLETVSRPRRRDRDHIPGFCRQTSDMSDYKNIDVHLFLIIIH